MRVTSVVPWVKASTVLLTVLVMLSFIFSAVSAEAEMAACDRPATLLNLVSTRAFSIVEVALPWMSLVLVQGVTWRHRRFNIAFVLSAPLLLAVLALDAGWMAQNMPGMLDGSALTEQNCAPFDGGDELVSSFFGSLLTAGLMAVLWASALVLGSLTPRLRI
jgi:hypothetical protein